MILRAPKIQAKNFCNFTSIFDAKFLAPFYTIDKVLKLLYTGLDKLLDLFWNK